MTTDCVECQKPILTLTDDCGGPAYSNFPGELDSEVYIDTRFNDTVGRAFAIGMLISTSD